MVSDDRGAFDGFGEGLENEEGEAEDDDGFDGSAHEAIGVGGHFAPLPGADDFWEGRLDDEAAEGNEEEEGAEEVGPSFTFGGPATVEDVNADMVVLLEGVGAAEQEDDAVEVPLEFEVAVGGEFEREDFAQFAGDDVEGTDGDHDDEQ